MSHKVELKKQEVRDIIDQHYGLTVDSMKPVRGILLVMTDKGNYSFKNAEEMTDLPFVNSWLKSIRRNGFSYLPELVLTLNGQMNVDYEGQQYYMERWVEGHELSKQSHAEESLGKALAEFHRSSAGIVVPRQNARYGYGKRVAFLLECRRKLDQWSQSGESFHEFDKQALDFLTYRCRLAYSYIQDVPVQRLSVLPAICHGSLHHENILIDPKRNIWLIDFESLVYAERVLDLAQLIHYYAYPHEWNPDVIRRILRSYQKHHQTPLSPQERRYFMSYLCFPRRLANSMLQYFDHEPSSPKHYTKLIHVIEQEWTKERFLATDSKHLDRSIPDDHVSKKDCL